MCCTDARRRKEVLELPDPAISLLLTDNAGKPVGCRAIFVAQEGDALGISDGADASRDIVGVARHPTCWIGNRLKTAGTIIAITDGPPQGVAHLGEPTVGIGECQHPLCRLDKPEDMATAVAHDRQVITVAIYLLNQRLSPDTGPGANSQRVPSLSRRVSRPPAPGTRTAPAKLGSVV